jgi:hypothetical protein
MREATGSPRFDSSALLAEWRADVKHFESYVAEAKARRRRQLAMGLVGAVMLATLAVSALMVFGAPAPLQVSSGQRAPSR